MARLVKCAFCGLTTVDKSSDDYIRYHDKNFHKECGKRQQERDEFFDYVCLLYKLKAPGPRIYSQASKFVTEKGYTYKGMARTLYFMYEVQSVKNNRDWSNATLGLIPYYYDDAQRYFAKRDAQKVQSKYLLQKYQKEQTVVTTQLKPSTTRAPLYNIDEIE